jgi:hypothetical protein
MYGPSFETTMRAPGGDVVITVPRTASPRLPPDAAPVAPGRQFANLVHARKKPKQPAGHSLSVLEDASNICR